jgi:hypothetical protein
VEHETSLEFCSNTVGIEDEVKMYQTSWLQTVLLDLRERHACSMATLQCWESRQRDKLAALDPQLVVTSPPQSMYPPMTKKDGCSPDDGVMALGITIKGRNRQQSDTQDILGQQQEHDPSDNVAAAKAWSKGNATHRRRQHREMRRVGRALQG